MKYTHTLWRASFVMATLISLSNAMNIRAMETNALQTIEEEKTFVQLAHELPKDIQSEIALLKIGEFFLRPKTLVVDTDRLRVAISNNNVVIGLGNNTVQIHDIDSGELLHIFIPNFNIRSVAIDGKTLVVGSYNGIIQIWDIDSEQLLHTFDEGAIRLNSVAISGNKIITGSDVLNGDGGVAEIYDINTGEVITLGEHASGVWSVAISSDKVVTGTRDGVINIWNINGQLLHTFVMGNDTDSGFASVSIRGDKVVIGLRDGTVKIWDMHGQLLNTLPKQHSAIGSVAISGDKVAIGLDDGNIKIWSLSIDLHAPEFNTRGEVFTCMKNTLTIPQADLLARAYNATQAGQLFTIVDLSEDGKVFLTFDKAVRMYLLKHLNIKLELDNPYADIEALFAPISHCTVQ